jgi:hypothetical protein
LQEVFDLLVDRQAAGPAGGSVAAPLDVSGEQFDAGQQAAHAAHVLIAVAANFVMHAVQDQRAVLQGRQRLENLLEREPEPSAGQKLG